MKPLLLVVMLLAIVPGCELCHDFGRTMSYEPEYWCSQEKSEHWARRSAREAWRDWCECQPKHSSSADYREGFLDGFSDYLELGGTGAPPPVPPKQYWSACYQSAEGHQAILEWYAGFRDGACMACQSGCHSCEMIPSNCCCQCQCPCPAQAPPPAPAPSPTLVPQVQWQILSPLDESLKPEGAVSP
jgi:hypothetical protein